MLKAEENASTLLVHKQMDWYVPYLSCHYTWMSTNFSLMAGSNMATVSKVKYAVRNI